jgi:hypothetical protein
LKRDEEGKKPNDHDGQDAEPVLSSGRGLTTYQIESVYVVQFARHNYL